MRQVARQVTHNNNNSTLCTKAMGFMSEYISIDTFMAVRPEYG